MVWLHGMYIPMEERYRTINQKVEKEIQARKEFFRRLESIDNCFAQSNEGETGYEWENMKKDLTKLYENLPPSDQEKSRGRYQATLESIDFFAKTEKEGLFEK